MEMARKHKLVVIEDACQAHGSAYQGKRAGLIGHSTAFSFYPGKNLGAFGDAGGIVTNDAQVANKVKMLRDHGMPRKYVHAMVGRNDRMDGLQGAVLTVKLKHLDAWNDARRKHAEAYRSKLSSVAGVKLFATHPDRLHNYHLFVVRVKNRDALQKKLAQQGIATGIHYPIPIHLQEAYEGKWKKGDFPTAEQLADEILSLPMYAELTQAQIEEVCSVLKTSL